jgi:hypothetical protein
MQWQFLLVRVHLQQKKGSEKGTDGTWLKVHTGGGSEGSSGSVQKNSRQIRNLCMIFPLSFSNQWQQHPMLGAIPFLLRWIICWFFSSRRRTLLPVVSWDIWILGNISMIGMPVKGMVRAIVLAAIKLQTFTTYGAWSVFPQMLHGQNLLRCCKVRIFANVAWSEAAQHDADCRSFRPMSSFIR